MGRVYFDRNTVGLVGVAFACLQFLALALFFIPWYMLIVTPELLASLAIQEAFHVPGALIGVLMVSEVVFLSLTVGLTIGIYRGSLVSAIVFALEVAGYVAVAAWGWLSAPDTSFFRQSRFLALHTIYAGVLFAILLFVVSGILGAFRRASVALKAAAGAAILASILIPIGVAVGAQAQKGSVAGHMYRADGAAATQEVILRLNPNPFTTGGDPAMPGFTIASGGQYTIRDVPAGPYTISAAAVDLYTEKPVPIEVRARHQTARDFVAWCPEAR